MPRSVEILFLGTSAGTPTASRGLPSILVTDWNGFSILLDAGEGVQYRLRETGVHPTRIDAILVTHAHGDHINGLPGLLQTMYMLDRSRPLLIAGPPSVIEFVKDVLDVESYDFGFTLHLAPLPPEGDATLASRGGDSLSLQWAPACHTVDSRAYRLEWRLRPRLDPQKIRLLLGEGPAVRELIERGSTARSGRVVRLEDVVSEPPRRLAITYTGDTSEPCPPVERLASGSRILIHDSTFDRSLEREAVRRGHSSARLAAEAAARARAHLLVLTHISARYEGREARKLLEEARVVFPRVILAWDGLRLTAQA